MHKMADQQKQAIPKGTLVMTESVVLTAIVGVVATAIVAIVFGVPFRSRIRRDGIEIETGTPQQSSEPKQRRQRARTPNRRRR